MKRPARFWKSYGDDLLPSPAEALAAPLSAFPSWFIRMECERCGRERYATEVHLRTGTTLRCGRSSSGCTMSTAAAGRSWLS
jgi:hypothetical protein